MSIVFGLGEKALKALGKAGKAVLVFTVEKYPGDKFFDDQPPSIDLYIPPRENKEKEPPEELPEDYFKGTISPQTSEKLRSSIEEVETISSIFQRILKNKPKREFVEVWIVAKPHAHWRELYERTFYSKKLNSGQVISLTLALRPKDRSEKYPMKEGLKL